MNITPYNILDIELFCVDVECELYCSRIKVKSDDTRFTFKYLTITAKDSLETALHRLRKKLSVLSTWDSTLITNYNNVTFPNMSINKNILNKLIRKESL